MVAFPHLLFWNDRHTYGRFSRFAIFQVVSAYTNTGMSLVDQSMVPFQKAYVMIFPLVFLILAGNTCFVSATMLCGGAYSRWLLSRTADIVSFLQGFGRIICNGY